MRTFVIPEFTEEIVKVKIEIIRQELLEKAAELDRENFTRISVGDLVLLFDLYNREFFLGEFPSSWKIDYSFSNRMTRTAGKVIYHRIKKTCEIVIATRLLLRLDFGDAGRFYVVNGVRCHTRLECLMRVFEHELIHVLEFVLFGFSSCSKPRFRMMAYGLFGHTKTKHELFGKPQEPVIKDVFRAGDRVYFKYDGETIEGVIKGIRKRATVICEEGKSSKRGRVVRKFYVPLSRLEKVE